MISALILGELIADPVERRTSAGATFVTATVRTGAGAEPVLIGLACFSQTAATALLHLRKGDSVAATGPLELNLWTDRQGRERRDWRMTAGQVMTVYEANKRRKSATDPAGQRDDADPFGDA